MGIISRYILKNHLAPFIFGTVLVMFLFLFQFIMKSIDELVGKGLSNWVIIQLIGLNLSWMFVWAVPMGVLFSTLMAFGNMSSVQEITIIKSSGGSLVRMMMPVIICGFLLTLFVFWFNDEILPEANHQAKVLMMDIKRKKPTFSIEAGQFSQQLEGYTIMARQVDSINGTLKGVTIYDNRNSGLINVLSADTGIAKFTPDMSKMVLDLYNGEIQRMVPNMPENFRKVNFKNYQILIDAQGFNLDRSDGEVVGRGDREMHIRDMRIIVNESLTEKSKFSKKLNEQLHKHYDFISGRDSVPIRTRYNKSINEDGSFEGSLRRVQRRVSFLRSSISSDVMRLEDYDEKARQFEVEIQKKYAIPVACFVFIFVGCPLGIMTKGGNFGISAAISIGFYILYWASFIGGEKLADRGLLNPVLSMWLADIVVFVIGILLVIKVNNESLRIPGLRYFKRIFFKNEN